MSGPLWTRSRLQRVMRLRFGITRFGAVDTRAAAAAMGVSQRTVQRWLAGSHGRALAHIPAARLEQLISLLLPSGKARVREAQAAGYAAKAIASISRPSKLGLNPAWEKQRWLEPHLVAVIEVRVHELRIRQLAIARDEAARTAQLHRRGRVVDQTVVPTRFHATMLTHHVLTALGPWRFQAGTDQVVQGYTQAWVADAPRIDLGQAAAAVLASLDADEARPDA